MRRLGIVNRGECAVRMIQALEAMRLEGVEGCPQSVFLCTEADRDSLASRRADQTVFIGQGREAYLDSAAVIEGLRSTGCEAAWLGWGFASEDAEFAADLEAAGITLLAPRPETMRLLGDKVQAKLLAEQHDVPVAPWALVATPEEAVAAAPAVGFPLLVKAAGGGGGRGIRFVDTLDEVAAAFVSAQDEAARSFRSHAVMLERVVTHARHVEVQMFGDGEGNVVDLGVRDCSLQRRRQKVIEECPAPKLPAHIERILIESARRLCAATRYRSAGTVEFLYQPSEDAVAFLEVNTRLQVEHPVTELVYGVDLARAQVELAMGGGLPAGTPRGWAIEARLCAEDPANAFAPAPGRLARFAWAPSPGARVDTGFEEGDVISEEFDPLIAKVIAWGPTRAAAIGRLTSLLDRGRVVIEGGTTNRQLLATLLGREDFRAGEMHTGLVDGLDLAPQTGAGIAALAAAIDRFLATGDRTLSAPDRHRVEAGEPVDVYRISRERFRVVGAGGGVFVDRRCDAPTQCTLVVNGQKHRVERVPGDTRYTVDGATHTVAAASAGVVCSPSASLVLDVLARPGDSVEAGQCVAIVESMKMEVRISAPVGGTVREIRLQPGAQARAGQVILIVDTEAAPTEATESVIPWGDAEGTASARLFNVLIGWDAAPDLFEDDLARFEAEGSDRVLTAFCDIAELFERRAKGRSNGAAAAISPWMWLETLRQRGAKGLTDARRETVERALRHHGLEKLSDPGLPEALRRVERAGADLKRMSRIAVAALQALRQLEGAPPLRLLDRLALLDPGRFGSVADAAERTRYQLFEQPARDRLCARFDARAEVLLDKLRNDEAAWAEVLHTPDSLLNTLVTQALAGCNVAGEAVARRLEWHETEWPVVSLELAGQPAWCIGEGFDRRVICTTTLAHAGKVLEAAATGEPYLRLDLVIAADGPEAGERDLGRIGQGRPPAPAWSELCLVAICGPDKQRTRRFAGDGSARPERRDILPSTEHRVDLDRLSRFDIERLASSSEVVLFKAIARENRDDGRLMAYCEVRSLERAPGSPLHLPHIERVFHAATRAIQAAREVHDPRQRWHWNRITLSILPVVPWSAQVLRDYAVRLAPAALRVGLEKVVARARFRDPTAPGGVTPLMDLSISWTSGQPELSLRPASHKPLAPLGKYEAQLVAARRRGHRHPHELVSMLERGAPGIPRGRFEEHDLDENGELQSVSGRAPGSHDAGVVVGVLRSRTRLGPLDRVLILSDPTRALGALAEAECARVIAALRLARLTKLPVEWVAVSSGARIDWDTGTENLDWTAKVLAEITHFTQEGGAINILVPGLCVGAQAYWNAEATMLMHTRGLLVMTDRGSMVLTGKRALDFSGCVSAEDDLALGGYTSIMGPNGQAQAWAQDLTAGYRLLYRYYLLTYVPDGMARPPRYPTRDPIDRDIGLSPYPAELNHGFSTVGEIFSAEHNPDRKRPFACRPIMAALMDADVAPVERWGAMHEAETAVVWEARIGGYATTLIGIENRPVSRLGAKTAGGPDVLAGGTLYPQAARKIARALNAASGQRPAVVVANLSGFDGSPESLRRWQLEYGAEIGRAVVNFDGPIVFAVVSRYHGGAYVVFSKALNPQLSSVALEGSFASVIGGAPAAAVVFGREARRMAAGNGGGEVALAEATAELAARFDGIHTVERAKSVGSIDTIISPAGLRSYVVDVLEKDSQQIPASATPGQRTRQRLPSAPPITL